MAGELRKRIRDPEATREAIMEAASTLFAQHGADSVSVSAVANLAGINRGTAYQHFPSRESLLDATRIWISDRMFRAVFGDSSDGERAVEQVDIPDTMHRLTVFAMENAELGRSWLLHILAMEEPTHDPFWREFQGSLQRFSETELAQDDIDSEAMSVLVLSAIFLWPVWVGAHSADDEERRKLALRMSREILRLSLFGSMVREKFPHVVERLKKPVSQKDVVDIAGRR